MLYSKKMCNSEAEPCLNTPGTVTTSGKMKREKNCRVRVSLIKKSFLVSGWVFYVVRKYYAAAFTFFLRFFFSSTGGPSRDLS